MCHSRSVQQPQPNGTVALEMQAGSGPPDAAVAQMLPVLAAEDVRLGTCSATAATPQYTVGLSSASQRSSNATP